jgi:hypothetical protein
MARRSRTARLAGIAALAVSAAACAKSPDSVSASYVSPMQYQSYDCRQLEEEAARVSNRLAEATGAQEDAQTRDAVAMGVGLVLFWPALFFLAAGDSSEELARLKGEFEAIEKEAIRKECALAGSIREARARAEERRREREALEGETLEASAGPAGS